MPVNAAQGIQLAQSPVFTGRLQVLLCQYAQVIAVDANASALRKNLANRILSDPGGMTGKLAVAFVSHPNIEAATLTGTGATLDITDNDAAIDGVIQSVMNSGVWDNVI